MEFLSRFIASLLLILFLPFLLLITMLLLLFQGNPVLFKQERVGFKFKKFNIYKFRTMSINSGELITTYNDNRITGFGRFLRMTKIDELPQICNIIKGDMRFIGPRPEVQDFFSKEKFNFLEKIKPGLSDFSSILFRNEDIILKKIGGKSPYLELLPVKLSLAQYYAKKKSFMLDLKLVSLTIISIFAHNFVCKYFVMKILKKNVPSLENFIEKYNL